MFTLLKRLILWIVRVICVIGMIGGIAMAAMEESMRVGGIILAVVSLLIGVGSAKLSDKITTKAKRKKTHTCKHCKKSMADAQCTYRYDLGKISSDHVTLPVDITLTCPHCGKITYFPEYVYLSTYPMPDQMRDEAEKKIQKLLSEDFF